VAYQIDGLTYSRVPPFFEQRWYVVTVLPARGALVRRGISSLSVDTLSIGRRNLSRLARSSKDWHQLLEICDVGRLVWGQLRVQDGCVRRQAKEPVPLHL
jgi:hypothetical protein